jgi:5-methylcytosine-specific restriction protein A
MPVYPTNSKCAELGCKEPRSKLNSYCAKHGGIEYTAREKDSFYQTPAWRTVRRRQLSIQPLCEACLSRGRIEQAAHVDHVFPWRHIGQHAFLSNIFQSLCHADHSHKTALEQRGEYTHYTANGEKVYTKDDYAYVLHQTNNGGENP